MKHRLRRSSVFPTPPLVGVVFILSTVLSHAQDSRKENEGTIELSPFVVTSDKDRGYTAASTVAGSRFETSLKETSAVIGVLNREFLDDIQATDIAQAAAWGASIYTAGSEDQFATQGFQPNVTFRGVTGSVNSIARNYFPTVIAADAFETERIDLSHGPNAALYGEGTLGGVVSATTKRAMLGRSLYRVSARTDSEASFRTTVDINVPVGGDAALRFNGLRDRNNGWRDGNFSNKDALHIAGTWRIFRDTNLRGEISAGHAERAAPVENFGERISNWDGVTGYTQPRTTNLPSGGTVGLSNTVDYLVFTSGAPEIGVTNLKGWGRSEGANQPINPDPAVNAKYFPNRPGKFPVLPSREFTMNPSDTPMGVQNYRVFAGYLDHTFFDKLTIEIADQYQYNSIDMWQNVPTTLYADVNKVRPDGSPNPYFGHYYADVPYQYQLIRYWTNDARIMAGYTFGGKKWNQKIIALASQRRDFNTLTRRQVVRLNGSDPSILSSANTVYVRRYMDDENGPMGVPESSNGIDVGWRPTYIQKALVRTNTLQAGITGRYWDGKVNTFLGTRYDRWKQDIADKTSALVTADIPPAYIWRSDDPVRNASSDPKMKYPYEYGIRSSNAGVVYFPIKALGVYANYSEGFYSPAGYNSTLQGGQIEPPDSYGYDFGIKLDLFDGRISGSINRYQSSRSGYDSAMSNLAGSLRTLWDATRLSYRSEAAATADPAKAAQLNQAADLADTLYNDLPQNYTDKRNIDANGWELDLTANFTKNWRAIINASVTDNKLTGAWVDTRAYYDEHVAEWRERIASPYTDLKLDTTLTSLEKTFADNADGRALTGTPDYTANFFTTYRIPDGRLRGLKFGGGMQFQGPRIISVVQVYDPVRKTFVIPDALASVKSESTALATAMIAYEFKLFHTDFVAQLNVSNLFDEDKVVYTNTTNYTYTDSTGATVGQQWPTRFRYTPPRSFVFSLTATF
ncbi:MAG TPA: TonB-dependent receptor [Opitutaceae bacterium]|nr:TonB-dependent receptor [Opitutaceae bacterium]